MSTENKFDFIQTILGYEMPEIGPKTLNQIAKNLLAQKKKMQLVKGDRYHVHIY